MDNGGEFVERLETHSYDNTIIGNNLGVRTTLGDEETVSLRNSSPRSQGDGG